MSWPFIWWTDRAPRGYFWLYFSAAIFVNFGFSVFFFLFNLYLLTQGLNERSVGFIGSAMAIGTLCGTLPAGILAQRHGLRPTLLLGIAIACVASVLRVSLVSNTAQIGFAIAGGFGLSVWGVCLSPAVAGLTSEEQRPVAFSIMFASGIGVAGLGGLAAGRCPALLRSHSGIAMSTQQSEKLTILLGCLVASISLLLLSRLRLPPPPARSRFLRPSTPFLRRFLPAMALWSFVAGAFPPFASIYFVHHLGLSLEKMGSVFSLAQLIQFGAILIAPILFRRMGLSAGILLTQLVTAVMLFALASAHTVAHAAWLYWGYMGWQCMNEPGIYSLLMDRVPAADRNGASSYTFFVSSGSQIIASTAIGTLIVGSNYSVVLYSIATAAVVAALLFRRLQSA
jgi:MFS family permease